MGIYDRDYYQGPTASGRSAYGSRSMMLVTQLVIVNVAIFLIDALIPPGHLVSDFLALKSDVYLRPWQLYQLITCGFAHAPLGSSMGIWHVGMNMFMLWMFGRVIEMRLGRTEFLTFYLVAIVCSSLAWLGATDLWLFTSATGRLVRAAGASISMLGASGAVMAVFVLFVLYYPRQTLYILGLFPVPAWLIGLLVVGADLLRGMQVRSANQDHVAWQAHLAGAALAYLYFRYRWNFSRLLAGGTRLKWPRMGPRLKVHHPDLDNDTLDEEADRILDKVHREGLDRLTSRERRILEQHSRRLRERQHR